ncbi:TetR/AcrR family transcriptional regulator [Planococcus sp. N028]|uniref:TetR/AcrR family transcriptional regulator n=1 Tax=Planococcus shixiaomingii TaxID=3058393 RepID=A0ABT8MYL1_9BACL|nr:TetR/AcrR family transcriptional regulator [Planococcus sp. N028]MDN7240693.1 TetR/AcrR family transcriptional regulator [Planococcus sp. N028]
MSAEKILHIALNHFANEGYEGASLGKIAEEAGIKKPSIYAHYKGKDDLFLSAMNYALNSQKFHLATYFREMRDEPLQVVLLGYFEWFIKEIDKNEEMKFILRSTYFPPIRLEKEIAELINPFFDNLHRHLTRMLRERERHEKILYSDDYSSCALAFITVTEGTITELVYSGIEGYEKRFKSVWPVFWRGLIR